MWSGNFRKSTCEGYRGRWRRETLQVKRSLRRHRHRRLTHQAISMQQQNICESCILLFTVWSSISLSSQTHWMTRRPVDKFYAKLHSLLVITVDDINCCCRTLCRVTQWCEGECVSLSLSLTHTNTLFIGTNNKCEIALRRLPRKTLSHSLRSCESSLWIPWCTVCQVCTVVHMQ